MDAIRRIGSGIALAAAVIGIVSRLGAWLEPADFLNQFALWWLAGGVAGGLAALATSRANAALAPAVGLIVLLAFAAQILLPELRGRRPVRDGLHRFDLRLAEFNLSKLNPDPASAAMWLRAQRADIVVLEEAIGSGPDVPELLRREFPFQQACVARGPCSTVLLARRRPLASGGLARADPENRRGLSAAWMRFSGPCGDYTVVAVHLSRPWPWRGSAADRAELMDFTARQPPERLIVAGDFNLAGSTFAIRRFDAAARLHRLTGLLATWPDGVGAGGLTLPPLLSLDQVHAGSDWRLRTAERGPSLGSDHLPIVVTLASGSCGPPPAARLASTIGQAP